ncbi:hypothetical protein BJX64DRAFT_292483 [Aspergillus heterothallicus]
MASTLSKLTPELILIITDYLDLHCEINAVSQCTRRIYQLLNQIFYTVDARLTEGHFLLWAAANGIESTAFKAIRALKPGTRAITYALTVATYHAHENIVELLCKQEISLDESIYEDNGLVLALTPALVPECGTPLTIAAIYGNLHIVNLLHCHGARADCKGSHGRPAIIQAARDNQLPIIRRLICAGVEINVQDDNGTTPLLSAAEMGNTEVVEFLLEAGADLTTLQEMCLLLPLVIPVWSLFVVYSFMVPSLLVLRAMDFPRAVQSEGEMNLTARAAASARLTGVLEQLISKGWSPNSAPTTGTEMHWREYTASLGWVARHGQVDVVRFLLSHGADLAGTHTADGEIYAPLIQPLQLALLLDRARDDGQPLSTIFKDLSAGKGCGEQLRYDGHTITKWLHPKSNNSGGRYRKRHGFDIARPEHQVELLGYAASSDDRELSASVFKYLLAEGFDVEAKNADGNTALLEAVFQDAESGLPDPIYVLLERGANPCFQNASGECSFVVTVSEHWADPDPDIARALLDAIDKRQIPFKVVEPKLCLRYGRLWRSILIRWKPSQRSSKP